MLLLSEEEMEKGKIVGSHLDTDHMVPFFNTANYAPALSVSVYLTNLHARTHTNAHTHTYTHAYMNTSTQTH